MLAVLIPLFQWLFPIPSNTSTPPQATYTVQLPLSSNRLTGTLNGEKTIWNVPHLRKPIFTGREALLQQLHDRLTATGGTAVTHPQALTGLGGIGKTQTAVEYAYLYQQEYQAILWVSAATKETLISNYIELARVLQLPEAELLLLPEKEVEYQTITRAAVKRWLQNTPNWLLILDNADDLRVVEEFLPGGNKGHILFTTRAQAPGTLANHVEVEQMDVQEGSLLLLRRACLLPPDVLLEHASEQDRNTAQSIVTIMDGLPLALDQAGAYIESNACNLISYLNVYQQRPFSLLKQRGAPSPNYPEPVARTWSLSFAHIEQHSPLAADLLRFCAFLAPDAIPKELIITGASQLTPLLQALKSDSSLLDEALGILRAYSLVRRNRDERALSMHRLVQAILQSSLSKHARHRWAERTVRAVNQCFPSVKVDTWPTCRRLLPHAQICAQLIAEYGLAFPEGARLLHLTGYYLHTHAQYAEVEPLYQRSLIIRKQVLGHNHPDIATSLNDLARLYRDQGKYEWAIQHYQQALAIREKLKDPMAAQSLNGLATLYSIQCKYEQAEELMEQVQTIYGDKLGPAHPEIARSRYILARLYHLRGNYKQAELLYEQTLTMDEQIWGKNHTNTASCLDDLAKLYYDLGQYKQAEDFYQRSRKIRTEVLVPRHSETATSLHNLASLERDLGYYEKAEQHYQEALEIREQTVGPNHPSMAQSLNSLAGLYRVQGKYKQAEPLIKQALAIYEQAFGFIHADRAKSLHNLARLYCDSGDYEQAESLYQDVQAIDEQVLGPKHPNTAQNLSDWAKLYYKQGKYKQAEPLYQRTLTIREEVLGLNHSDTARSYYSLARLYHTQNRYDEAEPLYQQALTINERVYGPQHPHAATGLYNLAKLFHAQGKYEQAESYYKRALEINEQVLGDKHIYIASCLNGLALLYKAQGHYEQAEPLLQRTLEIRERVLGADHPATRASRENYAQLLQEMKNRAEGTG